MEEVHSNWAMILGQNFTKEVSANKIPILTFYPTDGIYWLRFLSYAISACLIAFCKNEKLNLNIFNFFLL